MDGHVAGGKFSRALFDKNVRTWVGKGAMTLASEMPYFRMLSEQNTTDQEMFKLMDGVERGELIQVPENGRYPEETDLPGFTTTYVVRDYALIKSISKVAGRADASAHAQKTASKLAASLGRGYIRALNRSILDIIRNGFDTSYTSYGDGKPLMNSGFKTLSNLGKAQRWVTLSKQENSVQLQRLSERASFGKMRQSELCV